MKVLASLAVLATSASAYTLKNFFDENEIITRVNNAADSTWVAGKNSVFDNMDTDDIRSMMGTFVANEAPKMETNGQDYNDIIPTLPKEFDARQRWGPCVHPIRSQLKCGSCWSFAGTEALSDRFCIAGKDLILSPQYLVSCDGSDDGCGGGRLSSAWQYMNKHGIATDSCVEYTSGNGTAPKCMRKCEDGEKITLYRTKSAYSVVNFFDFGTQATQKIQAEIFKNGPIEAGYNVFQDFLQYKGGVYSHREGNMVGGHAVKMIGWGEDPVGGPYWLIANSWGPEWGENGFFRIARGKNECGIERDVWAGIPDVDHTYNVEADDPQ